MSDLTCQSYQNVSRETLWYDGTEKNRNCADSGFFFDKYDPL